MKATVVEISGYLPAIMSLYMTGKNVDAERLENIKASILQSTDRCGTVIHGPTPEFKDYMDKIIKYGVQHEHETILDFIKVSIFFEGIHRGAQDDYDAHAKRMDIIRSSTRANKKSTTQPEISDWYKDKIIPTSDIAKDFLPKYVNDDGVEFVLTNWGYVRTDLINNNDVLRGLVPLSLACDNISTISFRNLRHIYHLRRLGTHASPELQDGIEMVREDLYRKCWWLGEYLGKVWTDDGKYCERNKVKIVAGG